MPTHEGSYPPTPYKMKSARPRQRHTWPSRSITALVLAWCLIIYYQESYLFRSAIQNCNFDAWTSSASPSDYKIALIGDPQLVDENTYNRRGLALAATKFYTDLYMRRNFRLLHKYTPLNKTIFMGDLFDGGREWGNTVWLKEFERFQGVFPTSLAQHVVTSLPGNHDIGISDGIKYEVYSRFKQIFGETSVLFDIGKWEIILLDTVSLSSPDARISGRAREFMDNLKATSGDKSRMLITHVPLYRPGNAPCGPLRETNSSIKIQRGHQYQNVVDAVTSDQIWDKVKPSVIFAGDDHDYCDYRHDNGVHEINVKSFSWAMGIHRPGYQLVSFSGTRYETKLCLLPGQLPLFLRYAILLLMTFSFLLASSVREEFMSSPNGLPFSNKDDSNKRRNARFNKLQVWRTTWQKMSKVAVPVLIFYTYMIWW